MSQEQLLNLFLSLFGLTAGAFLGLVISISLIAKTKGWLPCLLYGFSVVVFLAAIATLSFRWSDIKINCLLLAVVLVSGLSAIGLILITKYYLDKKESFTTKELNPIVNKFTQDADNTEIKLFGGDLSFLGSTAAEMDGNVQYSDLKLKRFKSILILCESPSKQITKARYGKILLDMPGSEFRYYNPKEADLQLRGRIIRVNRATRLLMYVKVKSGVYKTVNTDTASDEGTLYDGIWTLTWSLAVRPTQEEIAEYKRLSENI